MSVLAEVREVIARMQGVGRRVARVEMHPEVWEQLKAEYVAETGRFGPLEIIGEEVLGVRVLADNAATIRFVEDDETDELQ